MLTTIYNKICEVAGYTIYFSIMLVYVSLFLGLIAIAIRDFTKRRKL